MKRQALRNFFLSVVVCAMTSNQLGACEMRGFALSVFDVQIKIPERLAADGYNFPNGGGVIFRDPIPQTDELSQNDFVIVRLQPGPIENDQENVRFIDNRDAVSCSANKLNVSVYSGPGQMLSMLIFDQRTVLSVSSPDWHQIVSIISPIVDAYNLRKSCEEIFPTAPVR